MLVRSYYFCLFLGLPIDAALARQNAMTSANMAKRINAMITYLVCVCSVKTCVVAVSRLCFTKFNAI